MTPIVYLFFLYFSYAKARILWLFIVYLGTWIQYYDESHPHLLDRSRVAFAMALRFRLLESASTSNVPWNVFDDI